MVEKVLVGTRDAGCLQNILGFVMAFEILKQPILNAYQSSFPLDDD